ncbi:MAG TPA: hypothetical protein VMA13_03610 [Candidatus Saccharimonadales bacterium]|nr:hypothetical protein [Candidatus Saccharimonadales bacterium]
MKSKNIIVTAVATSLALLVTTSEAQQLDLSGTLEDYSTFQWAYNLEMVPVAQIASWVVSDPGVDPQGDIFVYQVLSYNNNGTSTVALPGFTSSLIVGTPTAYSDATAGTYTFLTGSGIPDGRNDAGTGSFSWGGFIHLSQTYPDIAAFDDGNLTYGLTSDFLVIDTDVDTYSPNSGILQAIASYATGPIYAPTAAPVPEPPTFIIILILIPLGIGAILAIRKERTI